MHHQYCGGWWKIWKMQFVCSMKSWNHENKTFPWLFKIGIFFSCLLLHKHGVSTWVCSSSGSSSNLRRNSTSKVVRKPQMQCLFVCYNICWGILIVEMKVAVYNKYAWFLSQLWRCWTYVKNFLWWLKDIFCSQWLFNHQSEESLERPRVEAIWEVPSHSFLWPPLLTIVNRSSFSSKEGGWGRPRLVWADKKDEINPEWSRLRCREVTFQEDLVLRREAKQRMSCIKKTRDICMHDAYINVRW